MQNFESVVEQKCDQLLLKAIHFGASDIHLVPEQEKYIVHFRKYGKLTVAGEYPLEIADRMTSYFKFLSLLDISEKRKPQSGSFQRQVEEGNFSFRVSTLPSVFMRESVVIRLMLQNHTSPLAHLAYNSEDANLLLQLIEQKQGIFFLTGATGSGKTTTLYSLIHHCTTNMNRHVISLEDPVENKQPHLLQIQVNERAGVTYAAGLKAILRHSPDVIMIGEIRDRETAHIAIEAALTGHLVLSTIHSKDTIGCLYRLLDLGIPLEDLKQTILAIVAQSLVQPNDLQDTRQAIYEVLHGEQLFAALNAIYEKQPYSLPITSTLSHQLTLFENTQKK